MKQILLFIFIFLFFGINFSQEKEESSNEKPKYQVRLITDLSRAFTLGRVKHESGGQTDLNFGEIDIKLGARFYNSWGHVTFMGIYKHSVITSYPKNTGQLQLHFIGGAIKYTQQKKVNKFKPFFTLGIFAEAGVDKERSILAYKDKIEAWQISDYSYYGYTPLIIDFSAGCSIELSNHFNLYFASGFNFRSIFLNVKKDDFQTYWFYSGNKLEKTLKGVSFHIGLEYSIPFKTIK